MQNSHDESWTRAALCGRRKKKFSSRDYVMKCNECRLVDWTMNGREMDRKAETMSCVKAKETKKIFLPLHLSHSLTLQTRIC